MKRLTVLMVTIILALSLAACGGGSNSKTDAPETTSEAAPKPEPAATSKAEPTPAPTLEQQVKEDEAKENDENTDELYEIGQSIYFYDAYGLEGDAGDGLSAFDAADLLVTDLFAQIGYFDDLSHGDCAYIILDDLQFLDEAEGNECYMFTFAYSTEKSGLYGEDFYEAGRAAVDYGTGTMFFYLDNGDEWENIGTSWEEYYEANSENLPDFALESNDAGWSDAGDTDMAQWWGLYIGDGFSIDITNFDGTSFNFAIANLRNGEYIFEGVAALDPEDEFMAEYGDVGFYLYNDYAALDILTSESSEWAHLRGQYIQED